MAVDVVVVGAGAAGIGAGLELRERGVPFVILEAAERVGGRAFTDAASLPGVWDQGCHWLHCADVNPLVPFADRLGADYERRGWEGRSMSWTGGAWQSPEVEQAADARIGRAFDALRPAAAQGPDRQVAEVLPPAVGEGAVIRYILQLQSSADPEQLSLAGFMEYADTGVDWAVRSGLGALIAQMAEGLPVRLGTVVSSVRERAGGVQVEAAGGTVAAKAAIVTVSTNVLAAGAIRFDPGPARSVAELAAEVPCGAYEKIAIALRRLPVDPGDAVFFWIDPADGQTALHFQLAATQPCLLIAHVGGQVARDLAQVGEQAMVALATERLAAAFGADIRKEIVAAAVTGWQANPFVRGAYSYTRPGLAARRREMIAAETGNVAFAGEAFSLPWHATAHGAYQSGRDAAARLAERLRA